MVKKIIINLIIILVVFIAIEMFTDAFMPVFTNDMALDQLENDDMSYSMWRLWNYLPHVFNLIKLIVCIICGSNIFTAIVKMKKENI